MTAPWYYSHAGVTHGPFSTDEIREHAARKQLLEDDLLWQGANGRKHAMPAQAALDFANLPAVSSPAPDWLGDVANVESTGPVPLPAPSTAVPDWLDDVANAETKGPVPGPAATKENPGWLDDLRLWYSLEPYTAAKTTQPDRVTSTPTPPVAASPAPAVEEKPGQTGPPTLVKDSVAARAVDETGIDLQTGRIVDAAKFRQWQRSANTQQPAVTNHSLIEIFRKARTAIENWVDDESRRPLILASDLQAIKADEQLVAILGQFQGYGFVMQDKLVHHLEFMVENRRRYYRACARP